MSSGLGILLSFPCFRQTLFRQLLPPQGLQVDLVDWLDQCVRFPMMRHDNRPLVPLGLDVEARLARLDDDR